jgi:hypothetical protein
MVFSFGIVLWVILYFLFFLLVITNLNFGLALYKLCLTCAFLVIALLIEEKYLHFSNEGTWPNVFY